MLASPLPPLPGGATALRALLASGAGYQAFIAGLPEHLSPAQRREVWRICRRGMQDLVGIARNKVRDVIQRLGVGDIQRIGEVKKGKLDPVYLVQLQSGIRLYVKYANDTVKAAQLGRSPGLKPRARLYAERRVLKWLAERQDIAAGNPEVVYFERRTRTLVLSDVCTGKRSLERDFEQGVFAPEAASLVAALLAQCHRASGSVPPFWGDAAADLQHWRSLLAFRTRGLQSETMPAGIAASLDVLYRASENAAVQGFYHLDYCPKNIFLNGPDLAVIDFESSASTGDPACDFGFLLGHCCYWGVVTSCMGDCLEFLHRAVGSYRKVRADRLPAMSARTGAFAGAAMIHCLDRSRATGQMRRRVLDIAAKLLAQNPGVVVDLQKTFSTVLQAEAEH